MPETPTNPEARRPPSGPGRRAMPPAPQGRVAAPAPSRFRWAWPALLVLALVAGGAYVAWSISAEAREMRELSAEAKLLRQLRQGHQNKAPIFVPLDEFLVNLPSRDGGSEGFLQAKIVLRTDSPETEVRLRQFLPLVRDRVIAVLSSRSMGELASIEGKNALANDVALVVNAVIEPQLTAVHILQQQPTANELRNLERMGAIPRDTPSGGSYTALARDAATALARVTMADLPVQQVLFTSLVMQ